MTAADLSLLTFNIGNPSAERARRQLRWLITRDEDVLVLTETKDSAGCRLLAGEFTAAGYAVHWPPPFHGVRCGGLAEPRSRWSCSAASGLSQSRASAARNCCATRIGAERSW